MANCILWYYNQEFNYLINQNNTGAMDLLYNEGIKNIWMQIGYWQNTGPFGTLPCVLPANPLYGGQAGLNSVISKARSQYKYRVGLYENYVDYYPGANCSPYGYNQSDVALDSYGNFINAHSHNGYQSYLLKPSRVSAYVNHWTNAIQLAHPGLNGCYLDVHSSVGPNWNYVDCDASVSNAGMFRETIQKYRELYPLIRTKHNGPVQGEGGNQLFYQGYADDIEARLTTPNSVWMGMNLPLFVDFDMNKLRDKAFVHGVGWHPVFYCSSDADIPPITKDIELRYIATELAYGHGAYLPTPNLTSSWRLNQSMDDLIEYAKLEYNHVFSVQKHFADANPVQILYNDNGTLRAISDFLRAHPNTYKDITSADFMGQVKIVYDNGIIVYVNRHPNRTWQINEGVAGHWFNYNANGTQFVGISQTTSFSLPPNNGWLVYDPLKTKVTFTNKIISGNAGGELLLDNRDEVTSGDFRWLRIGYSLEVKTLNERFVDDSIRKHNNWNEIATDFTLENDFTVRQNLEKDAKFRSINPVTIKTGLLDGGIGGNIQFKDPWYVEQDGSQLNTFKSWPSPFLPTGAFGQTTGGVFLNQPYTGNNPVYYSVGVISPQPVTLNGRTHNFYFQNWAYDANKISLQYPNDLETGVVFKDANATLSANMKGTQLSNEENAYTNNSQRKFIRMHNNEMLHVYRSLNKIWLETSIDDGATWQLRNNAKPLTEQESKLPSVCQIGQSYAIITLQERKYDGGYYIKVIVYDLASDMIVTEGVAADPPNKLYIEDTNPVIACPREGIQNFLVVWEEADYGLFQPGGLYYRYGTLVEGPEIHWLSYDTFITESDRDSHTPTLVTDFNDGEYPIYFRMAYERRRDENYSSIYHTIFSVDGQDAISISPPSDVSEGAGFPKNSKPSMIATSDYDGTGSRLCWIAERRGFIDPRESKGGIEQKVIFMDPNYRDHYWNFGSSVKSTVINKSSVCYSIAWSRENNQPVQFTDSYTLSSIFTISNLMGKDVQMCNGGERTKMQAMAFNNAAQPYYFNSSQLYANNKLQIVNIGSGREGVVCKDSAKFYFAIGDITVNDQKVNFIEVDDSVSLYSKERLNEFLLSEPFALNDNSTFIYSVQYGITDSSAAVYVLDNDDFVNFKVELRDDQTGELLGLFDDIIYTEANVAQ